MAILWVENASRGREVAVVCSWNIHMAVRTGEFALVALSAMVVLAAVAVRRVTANRNMRSDEVAVFLCCLL